MESSWQNLDYYLTEHHQYTFLHFTLPFLIKNKNPFKGNYSQRN